MKTIAALLLVALFGLSMSGCITVVVEDDGDKKNKQEEKKTETLYN